MKGKKLGFADPDFDLGLPDPADPAARRTSAREVKDYLRLDRLRRRP